MRKSFKIGFCWICFGKKTHQMLFTAVMYSFIFFRLFPTDLFELFIDVGHYVRDLTAYEALRTKVSLYTVRKRLLNLFSCLFSWSWAFK